MKKIYFATSNKWKFEQARDYFKKSGIDLSCFPADLSESRSENVKRIVLEKARTAYQMLKEPLFTMDGAYEIKALKGFPKTQVKFVDKYIGSKGILKLLEGENERSWRFFNAICYKDRKQEKIFAKPLKGNVSHYLGEKGAYALIDIDRVFVPEGFEKPYSEFSKKEYQNYLDNVWKPTVFNGLIAWLKRL